MNNNQRKTLAHYCYSGIILKYRGNAVPPLMAYSIAKAIKHTLGDSID